MAQIVAWIVTAIATAWSLISGSAGVAGALALGAALKLLPARVGTVPAEWLAVANFYMPVNEAVTFFGIFLSFAGLMKIAKWTLRLQK
jgi:hypothetical protein